jgi:hypothetical protein
MLAGQVTKPIEVTCRQPTCSLLQMAKAGHAKLGDAMAGLQELRDALFNSEVRAVNVVSFFRVCDGACYVCLPVLLFLTAAPLQAIAAICAAPLLLAELGVLS